MKVLGIDPGSLKLGWGLVEYSQKKMSYCDSGVLIFNQKIEFIDRMFDIKKEFELLVNKINPDIIALESLIFVKSPTALIKLSQTRGLIISVLIEKYKGKIFEYSPNLIKSSTTGHGHASKESVQKFLSMQLGVKEFDKDDESDALAIAVCHVLNNPRNQNFQNIMTKGKNRSIASAVKHKIKEVNL